MNTKIAEYISMLQDRFPNGSDQDINDVTDLLYNLSDTDAELCYKCIVNNHEYNTFPKIPKIRKYMREDLGVDLTKKTKGSESFSCQVCDICHTKFCIEMSACPRCRKVTPVKIKKSDSPIHCVSVGHQPCGNCDKFFSASKAPICEHWGNYETAGDNFCTGCTCVDCCKKEYMRRTDYPRYRKEVLGMG